MTKKNIAILGAGFGGLKAAICISKKLRALNLLDKYEIILIDRNTHHTYTPLLYEVATTSQETADSRKLYEIAAPDFKDFISHLPVTLVQDEIVKISPEKGEIILEKKGDIFCHYAIIALGAETNYFKIPGLKKYSLPLKTFSNALKIREKIWNMFLENKKELNIAVGGAGATGIELAAEMKMWNGELKKDFPDCKLNVSLIEASPSILPGFQPKIIQIVRKRLEKLGVKIMENKLITSLKNKEIVFKDGEKEKLDVFIWTGGVKAPDILSKINFKTEKRGRVEVAKEMECLPQTSDLKLTAQIYAVGDSVCFYDQQTKRPIPGVATVALEEAKIAANNVIEEIKSEELKNYEPKIKNYVPQNYPYVIAVGGKFAVAQIGSFIFSGFWGWFFKGLVEFNYLLSIMPPFRALKIWLEGLWIFTQNDRLG